MIAPASTRAERDGAWRPPRLIVGMDQSMERIAIMMRLHPGQVEEYVRRHDNIWPDLVEQLHEHGIRDY